MGGGGRLIHVAIAFLAVAGAIVARLGRLQLGERDFWEREAVKARTRAVAIGFRRGAIVDRMGRPLASHRTTRNVVLVFSSFRKGTACGELMLSHWLLTGQRTTVAAVVAKPKPWIDELAALTVGDVRALEPGQRREDLLWYAAWLTGEERIEPLIEQLRAAPAAAPAFARLVAERAEIAARVRSEAATLRALSRAVAMQDDELIARIDAAIAATDARVARKLEKDGAAPRPYERERELHREIDAREANLVENVPHAAVFDLAADPARMPGLQVREEARRVYPPENDVCSLLIGRVGPPDESAVAAWEALRDERDTLAHEPFPTFEQAERLAELDEQLRIDAVDADDELGKEGLELAYEAVLRGRRGYRRTENDRAGRVVQELEVVPPIAGRDLALTLDIAQQKAAEAILARGVPKKGSPRIQHPAAFVLVELPRMEVRVMASWPAKSRAEVAEKWTELASDTTTRPLHPRAWRPYLPPPPGSSVKPLVAAFALTAGVIGPQTRLECDKDQLCAPGESKPVKCEGLHHRIDVHDALVKSCNHFFARVALAAKSERMVDWFTSVGLGRKTGFATATLSDGTFLGESLPDVKGTCKSERGGRNLMLLGLGQGMVDATPLQMAAAMGALAQRGYLPPTIIGRVGDERPARPAVEPLPISDAAWQCVVEAMRGVTLPGGTASPSHGSDLSPWDLATKTGTPQQGGSALSHSWLVGFFPSHAPRYAFALFVERTGMHGGDAAAPFLLELLTDPAFAELSAQACRSPADAEAVLFAVRAAGIEDDDAVEGTADGDGP
jgi:cell division protein FtsI/penicillin-binding protein 2